MENNIKNVIPFLEDGARSHDTRTQC